MGRHAVAQVTMNRAGRDPKKVCEVVAARKQFSWVNKSFGLAKVEASGGIRMTAKGLPVDVDAWNAAVKIARVTLNGRMTDFTHGATFYHANYVKPVWAHKLKLVSVIGAHRFYKLA